ncbi:hypothetical protein TWF506_007047 [Arthrobotrys conoides]|uniref:Uncharacterized protein n=1 Tax=Arthrobotrys conoides TaxID=74498 RepID=A0AAN8RW98_9PEZI
MKRRRIPPMLLLLLPQFSQIVQSFILGFQLSSKPMIELMTYPYPGRNSKPIDLTNCQEGPGEEVLAVGVINGVSQGISANTRRKMRGIALWREPDCLTTPDYLISWKEGIQGMQLADMALAGQVINIGSWMDLEKGNVHLQRIGGAPGYIYKFGGNGAGPDQGDEGETIYVEEGMRVVTTGKRTTMAAAKLELIKRAGEIRKAFLTVDEISDGDDDGDDGDDDGRYPPGPQPGNAQRSHGGSERLQAENTMANMNPQGQIGQYPSLQFWPIGNPDMLRSGGGMMANPFHNNFHPPLSLPYQSQNLMLNPFIGFSQGALQNNMLVNPSMLQLSTYLTPMHVQQGLPNINSNIMSQNNQPQFPTVPPDQDISQANGPSRTRQLEDISRFGYSLGLSNPMAPVGEVERRTNMLGEYLSDPNKVTVPEIVSGWTTVGLDGNSIPPELLGDTQVKNEEERLAKIEVEEEGQAGQGGNQVTEEIQMSRSDPNQGSGFNMHMAYQDNMQAGENSWDPHPFNSDPYRAGWQPLIPEPVYHNQYYSFHGQAPQGQELAPGWPTNNQLGMLGMLGIQENYPRILSEIYSAQNYGGQFNDPNAGIQLAGYGQDVAQDNNDAFPNDQYLQSQPGEGLINNGNIQVEDEIVPEEQLFEEEYSPVDEGDFFADDENFSGETRLSKV